MAGGNIHVNVHFDGAVGLSSQGNPIDANDKAEKLIVDGRILFYCNEVEICEDGEKKTVFFTDRQLGIYNQEKAKGYKFSVNDDYIYSTIKFLGKTFNIKPKHNIHRGKERGLW